MRQSTPNSQNNLSNSKEARTEASLQAQSFLSSRWVEDDRCRRKHKVAHADVGDTLRDLKAGNLTLPALPARVRGEGFDQPKLKSFSFFDCSLAVSICALHQCRAILFQSDVGGRKGSWSEEPPLIKENLDFVTKLYKEILSDYFGFHARLEQFVERKESGVTTEGPFVVAGETSLSLLVHVSRSTNYDTVYDTLHKALVTHRKHDERKNYENGELPRKKYRWTEEELKFAEDYPPEELLDVKGLDGEIIPAEVFMYLDPFKSLPKGFAGRDESGASNASDQARDELRRFFNRVE